MIASEPRQVQERFLDDLSEGALLALPFLFEFWALDHQLPPDGEWKSWVILGGRGAGKTRAGSEWVRGEVEGNMPLDAGRSRRVALVGETLEQAQAVMVEGDSGILSCTPPDRRPIWEAGRKRLLWPNGAEARIYSAHDPERLRGPQFDAAWCDELGCAAIDKGTNEPNKFLDPKSSESTPPAWSSGARDDTMQLQYYRAMATYWEDPSNNRYSELYEGRMIDMSRAFAWAWDARPFPRFPIDQDVWTDGPNYLRGHWLNGRAGSVDLAAIVRDVTRDAGLETVDTGALYSVVKGYALRDVVTARSVLEPLVLAAGANVTDRDGVLTFGNMETPPVAALNPGEMVEGDAGSVEQVRLPDAEVPKRMQISFIEAEGGFETRTVDAQSPGAETSPIAARTELPLSLSTGEARVIAETMLAAAQIGRERIQFSLPPSLGAIGAGDRVEIDGEVYRIDGMELGEAQSCEAVRVEVPVSSDVLEADALPSPSAVQASVPVFPVVLDLPMLSGDEVPHAPHVAVAADPWPGEVAVYASRTGESFDLSQIVGRPALVGRSLVPLAAAMPARWDNGPPLHVGFGAGDLLSVADADLLAGSNIAAIGQDGGPWEVFQFAQVNEIAPEAWALSRRLRGQLGTDALMPDVWPEGSLVVVWNKALVQPDIPSSARGSEITFRIGAANRPVSDLSYVERRATIGGAGLRPLSPVQLRVRRRGDDFEIRWLRRTRIDGDLWSEGDVPLGEAFERYLLRICVEDSVVREETLETPVFTYADAERDADGVGGPFRVEVAQVSDRFGPGPFTKVSVDG